MEPKFKTSFIPKKPIAVGANPGRIRRPSGFSFFTLLAVVLFLATIIFGGGVVVYKTQLQAQINNQLESLQTVRNQFDAQFISESTRLSSRIIAANSILDNHIAPSEIFALFEDTTLQTISFNNFSFADQVDGGVSVSASGIADSFRSIVLQSDEFGKNGVLRDVLFEGLQPNAEGNVSFSFTATMDPKFILYRKNIVEVVDTIDEEPEPLDEGLGVFGN